MPECQPDRRTGPHPRRNAGLAFSVPLDEKNLELIVNSQSAGIQVKSNDLFLRLILFNLLDNAIKYTPKGRGAMRLEALEEEE